MLQFVQSYSRELVAVFAVVLAFALNRVFRPRAKLIYSFRHAFTFVVEQPLLDVEGKQLSPRQFINTASISISNLGIQPAKKVEIVFNWEPQFLNVWPSRHYEVKKSPPDRHAIILDSLAPSEVFGMEILSINGQLPALLTVRSEDCVAASVLMIPQAIHPRWMKIVAVTLMTVGFAAIAYSATGLMQLVAHL